VKCNVAAHLFAPLGQHVKINQVIKYILEAASILPSIGHSSTTTATTKKISELALHLIFRRFSLFTSC